MGVAQYLNPKVIPNLQPYLVARGAVPGGGQDGGCGGSRSHGREGAGVHAPRARLRPVAAHAQALGLVCMALVPRAHNLQHACRSNGSHDKVPDLKGLEDGVFVSELGGDLSSSVALGLICMALVPGIYDPQHALPFSRCPAWIDIGYRCDLL